MSFIERLWASSLVAFIILTVWIGGGYGSGREIMEFIAKYGSLAWVSVVVGSIFLLVALYLSFEIARVFRAFDYYSFSKSFLWRAWPLFDILYVVMAWIVIAVIGAAAASVLQEFGIPYVIGALLILAVVGILHFYGRTVIEGFWALSIAALYIMYFTLWILTLSARGGEALNTIARGVVAEGTWFDAVRDGFRYTMYNLIVVIPALTAVDRFKGRAESIWASILGVILVYGTATLIWVCFMGFYPEIIGEAVPWIYVLKTINAPSWAFALYTIVLLYTLLTTGIGMTYGVLRRVDTHLRILRGRGLTRLQEAIAAVLLLAFSLITAQVGLIALVAKGYGTLAWAFAIIYFIPLVTIGAYRLLNPQWRKDLWEKV